MIGGLGEKKTGISTVYWALFGPLRVLVGFRCSPVPLDWRLTEMPLKELALFKI